MGADVNWYSDDVATFGDRLATAREAGGLSQSPFFQKVFQAGIRVLAPKAKVLISARKGPLRYQTAAYGALLNAMRPEDPHAAGRLCPVRSIKPADKDTRQFVTYLLRSAGL